MMITANNGFIEQSERYAFNNAGESLKKYILLEKGELAYNHGASKLRPYGSCFALTTAENARIPFVYHCFSVENQNAEFMSIELNSSEIENQLRKIVSSGARMDGLLNISFDEYSSVSVVLPSIEEQDRIAGFLRNLDRLITLHQRKYDKLTKVKKAMLEKMFPENGSPYPEIRFKGFTDAWEQRKLTEFVEFFSGLTYTPNDVQENGTLVLRSSNVSNGEVVDADNVYVNPQVVNSENVKVGDIVVVVRNGSRSLIGKHAQIKAFMPNTVIGAFMTGIRSECPEFTNALLNTSRFEEEIAMNMGATINQITGYMFSKMEFKVPYLDEQKKIGEYFEKLDHLITLHQRKYDKLQVLKKAMLEKMFPKNGSSVPEIRFKGFTDAWEQRKLGDCFTERCESMPDGELISVTINDGIKKFSELGRHDNSNDDKSKYKKVCAGDIAYNSMRMWQGASGCSPYEGIVSPAYTVLTPNSGINSKCMAYQFKLPATIHTFKINSQGITSDNWNLKFPALSEIEIYVSPYEQEQAKIAAYFANLDHLITLHQRELEKLQNIKKSMLEKMFV